MFSRTRIVLVAGMIVALALLAACGGGGSSYTINAGGWSGEWPWFWPVQATFVVNRDFSENVPVASHNRIRLDAVNGEIVVSGQPGAASVTVTAELIVGSNVSRLDAEEGLKQLRVLVTDRPGEIFVQTVQPLNADGRRYLVNYRITVPRGLAVDATQVNGNVIVEDIVGFVTVSAENGSIDATATLPPNGAIMLSTENGDIDLGIPASTSAELSALVEFGAITWDHLDLRNVVQTNRSLTGTLGEGAGLIDLDTRNGTIYVTGLGG